ncbi:hypothetical protein VSH64_26905 [Amycolatopsis rhabdoformis]|uniref:Tetratricopeptide repeat protein n=1 Tax=Amycolatopsis rhabdoformis TaxID=1448059 RepID=A0ABZ1HYP5_9PSEU|nr:hypothetical protein [Amycolatopsis rhabdoformis]WSE26509.1 hypothetical protein VSH64_26905 [Amycolatopsis rhabdoformis]
MALPDDPPYSEPGEFRPLAARLLMDLGHAEEARRLYRSLPSLDAVPVFMGLPAWAGTAELAADFGDRDAAADVYRRLAPFADDAVRHMRAAIEVCGRDGMPPYGVVSRYRLAQTLARRRQPGDRAEAAELASSAAANSG